MVAFRKLIWPRRLVLISESKLVTIGYVTSIGNYLMLGDFQCKSYSFAAE